MGQMKTRIRDYKGHFPVWSWFCPKPDLRRVNALWREPGVRIEFEAPADAVLLTHFEAWHSVLNGQYLAHTEAEWDEFAARFPKSSLRRGLVFDDPAEQAMVQATWERVFDLAIADHGLDWWGAGPPRVQAATEFVPLDWVKKVTPFGGKR